MRTRSSEDIPVACCLGDVEYRQREATLFAQFKSAATATEPLANGFLFRLPGDESSISLLAELMIAERECCRFLRFEMVAEPDLGEVTLRMSGPDGTKEFLQALLG